MENSKVYCIIITYNAMKWIDKCLGSLRISSAKIYPVIVDNGSKDGTVLYLSQYHSNIHLIINDENKGFGQANNQGIEYAYKEGATHFFLLNQDAWIEEYTVQKLIQVQEKYKIALVSPIHLNGQGDLLDYNYYAKIILDEDNREYVSDLILGNIKEYYTVFKINAAAWMLTRNTIECIGGFDPVYFHYGEDGNYCQRLKYHGKEVAFVPGAYIYHDRERQGNMKVYKKNSTIMMLLFLYSDINNSLWKIDKERIILHLSNLKLVVKFLFQFKFKEIFNIVRSYGIFFIKILDTIRAMKLNKRLGSNWLNLS